MVIVIPIKCDCQLKNRVVISREYALDTIFFVRYMFLILLICVTVNKRILEMNEKVLNIVKNHKSVPDPEPHPHPQLSKVFMFQ